MHRIDLLGTGKRFLGKYWVVIGLALFCLTPIWSVKFIPTLDGPSHLYIAQVLAEMNNPAYRYDEFFEVRPGLPPNLGAYLVLVPLVKVFPPLVAEKIFLTVYVVGWGLSVGYFLTAWGKERAWLVSLSYPLVFNSMLLRGFYGFSLGVLLYLWVVGFWKRHADCWTWKRTIVLGTAFVGLYLCHLVPFGMALLTIGFLSILHFRWNWKHYLHLFISTAPALGLFLIYWASSAFITDKVVIPGFEELWGRVLKLACFSVLVAYSPVQMQFSTLYFWGTLVLLAISVWHGIKRRTTQPAFAWLDPWGVFVGAMVLFFVIPSGIGSGSFLDERVLLMTSLLFLLCVPSDFPKILRWSFLLLFSWVAVVSVVWITTEFKALNRDVEAFTNGTTLLEESALISQMHLISEKSIYGVHPLVHAFNYYPLFSNGIGWDNYELGFDYFPVRLKPEAAALKESMNRALAEAKPDGEGCPTQLNYLVVWGNLPPERARALSACYTSVWQDASVEVELLETRRDLGARETIGDMQ